MIVDEMSNDTDEPGAPPSLDGVDRRMRETLKAVKEQGESLRTCVDDTKATRFELGEHRKHDESQLASIHAQLDEQKHATSQAALKIDEMQGQLTGIASTASEAKGELSGVNKALAILVANAEARSKVETAHSLAVLETDKEKQLALTEVDKSKQIAKVEDDADKAKTWRSILKKIVLGVVTFAVGAATAYFGLGG